MTGTQVGSVLHHLRSLAASSGPELTDGQLLRRFAADRDAAAFAALVQRHGRLVWSVCRNVLRHDHDAEDAFQASFLALARNAGSIRKAEALASWLHGVAYRVSQRALRDAARRRNHERRAGTIARDDAVSESAWRDLQAALDEEVQQLPERLRVPFVLCHLEGHGQAEAAERLGWKVSTLQVRLSQARQELLRRLRQRGISLPATLLAATLVRESAHAAVPAALMRSTIRAAQNQTPCALQAAVLAEGVKPAMLLTKSRIGKIVLVLLLGLATAGVLARTSAEERPAQAPKQRPATAPPQAGKVAVRGRILGPDGKPAKGARLYVLSFLEELKARPEPLAAAGEDGAFRVELAPRYEVPYGPVRRVLVAVGDGVAPDWIDPDQPGARGEVTLRLVKNVPIRGRVLTLEGRPVRGASLRPLFIETTPEEDLARVLAAYPRDSGHALNTANKILPLPQGAVPAGLPGPSTTDAEGRFTLTGVGRERLLSLRIEGDTIEHQTVRVVCRDGFDPKQLPKAPDRTGGGLLRMGPRLYGPTFDHLAGPSRLITGVVTEQGTGKPLARVSVNASGGGWWENHVRTTTDAKGRYRLVGLPKAERYSLWFHAGENRPYLPGGIPVVGDEGVGPLTADFVMQRGIILTGRVTDKVTGKPVAGSLIYEPLAGNKFFAKTPGTDVFRNSVTSHSVDSDGRFRLIVLPGSGLVHVRAGRNPNERPNHYTQAKLDPADRSKVYREDEGMGITFLTAGNRIESILFSNVYKLIDPAPDAGTLTLELQIDPGRKQTGKVVGPDGKPLTGARFAGTAAVFSSVVKLEGDTFEARALDPDQLRRLVFLHPERKLGGWLRVAGNEKEPPTVKLQPLGAVRGRLLDEDGNPLAGILVRAAFRDRNALAVSEESSALATSARTDEKGRFRIEGLIPGLEFFLVPRKQGAFLETKRDLSKLSVTAGEVKDLGDIAVKSSAP
jgi:RNA polymerase sigma factor (sigma-70 family)